MTVKLPASGLEIDIDFDIDAVRRRYVEERELRSRPESANQFQALSDAREVDSRDPHATPIDRDPIVAAFDTLVLGGGFGGLVSGARLVENGVTNFRIIEQAGDFGGTWYWNRYPGVQCDVESHVYLPLLEETGYVASKRYADGAEIFEHAQRIGRHFGLYEKALFQTTVTSVTWLDDRESWEIRTDRGDALLARFVVRANGPLSKPQLPRVPGIADFEGKVFHTSRWDYEYTGGNATGGLVGLRDKRVAIVGTGATGVQAIPYVSQDAQETIVIQRTPSVVTVRNNQPTDPAWAGALQTGWVAERQHNFLSHLNGQHPEVDMVNDLWTLLFTSLPGQHLVDVPVETLPLEDQYALSEIADMQLMLNYHRRIESVVEDHATAESLKPWFGFICKRPCSNDEFLQAFNSSSTRLVHAPSGIDRITASGLVVAGEHIEVDCIIFATGFETGSTASESYGYDVVGRDGRSWQQCFADGPKSLHGFHSRGFPNFLEVGLSQNAYVLNFTYMLDRKASHAAHIVAQALAEDIATIEVEQTAQDEWVEATHDTNLLREAYLVACTPGYYNGQGDSTRGFWRNVHNVSELDFWNSMDEWLKIGTFPGLEVKHRTTAH